MEPCCLCRISCHLPKQMSLRRNGCTSIHASTARTTRRSCSTLLYMGYWVSTMHFRNSALYTHRFNVLMMHLSHSWVSPGSTNSIMNFVVLSESSKAILPMSPYSGGFDGSHFSIPNAAQNLERNSCSLTCVHTRSAGQPSLVSFGWTEFSTQCQ